MDTIRQQVPLIVEYYCTLPLPPSGDDPYNRRLSLLRDRALVTVLYSTAGRISEAVSLDRKHVANGQAEDVLITGKAAAPAPFTSWIMRGRRFGLTWRSAPTAIRHCLSPTAAAPTEND